MILYSDRHLLNSNQKTGEISLNVHNGIIHIIKKYKLNLSKDYPDVCEDDSSNICGVHMGLLKLDIKAYIPNFKFETFYEDEPFNCKTEDILDVIEFIYDKLTDYENGNYHSFYNHYHLKFLKTKNIRNDFRKEINYLFERNNLIYILTETGEIVRILSDEIINVIKNINYIEDSYCNNFLNEAINKIKSSRSQDRQIAIERLWDVFERIKTNYGNHKKISLNIMIKNMAQGSVLLEELLNRESKELTLIGNNFKIRHFEAGTEDITSMEILDYFFNRMLFFISLAFSSINKEKINKN